MVRGGDGLFGSEHGTVFANRGVANSAGLGGLGVRVMLAVHHHPLARHHRGVNDSQKRNPCAAADGNRPCDGYTWLCRVVLGMAFLRR